MVHSSAATATLVLFNWCIFPDITPGEAGSPDGLPRSCDDCLCEISTGWRGTGVSGLTRGLATLPPRWIQEPSVVRDRDGRPSRGPSGSALLLCV